MDKKEVTLTSYGGAGSVTGSNFILEDGTIKIVVDCGLHQGSSDADMKNLADFDYDPASLDFVIITHAHMDHIGRLPKLVANGFSGTIYSTNATKELSQLMFDDALSLMENGAVTKLYKREDVLKTFSLWKTIHYRKETTLSPDVSITFRDAGHILGSAMAEFHWFGKKIVLTGDLGNSPSLLLRDTEKLNDVDYLLMESTYGDRNHEERHERTEKLIKVLNESIKKRGTIIIPSFSLERTQEILYELNEAIESERIPSVPVFVDSPLASRVTKIYEQTIEHYKEEVKADIASGDRIFDFPRLLHTTKHSESREIQGVKGPKIVIAGSGMSSGGRIRHHEALYLPDPQNTLIFVGYQGLGTLGRDILNGKKKVWIDDVEVPVKAKIEHIQGYSSHKDSDNLVNFVRDTAKSLKKVFVGIGEPKASLFLVQKLRDNLGVDAVYLEAGEKYVLKS